MPPRAKTQHQKTVEARRLIEHGVAESTGFAVSRRQSSLLAEEATNRLATMLLTLPDPDDTLRAAGLSRTDLRRLEKDDEVTQCIDKRYEAIVGTPWRLEPDASRLSRWLSEELAPHIPEIIRGALDAIFYGYSVQEVVYRPGARIGIDRVSLKPFEWFVFAPDGSLRYRPNDGSGGIEGLPCDPRKYLLARNAPSLRNPYGEALLSRLWWPVYYRTQLWAFRVQYLERFGTPLVVGKTTGDRAAFAQSLASLAANAAVAIGDMDSIEFAQVANNGEAFSKAEAELCARIQKLILGQTLTSEVGDKGSYAAASVHYQVQQDRRNADIRLVSGVVQQLVDTLCALNGQTPPRFVIADDTGLEMARAERDKILVEAGVVKLTRNYLMDRYDFEDGDFELPGESAASGNGNAPAGELPQSEAGDVDHEGEVAADMAAGLVTFARRKRRFTPQQQAIEDGADDLLAKIPEPIEPQAILAAVKAATDPADLAVRLSLLLEEGDPRFTELLARAQFAAQTLGYVVAETETPQRTQQANTAAQTINLSLPEAPSPVINVTVQPASQPAPVVHVAAPNQPAPVVNVEVAAPNVTVEPAQVTLEANLPAPEIKVEIPTRKTVTEIERDADGNIVRATQTETDKE